MCWHWVTRRYGSFWDIQHDTQLLARAARTLTKQDRKRLVRMVRYLKGNRECDQGMIVPRGTSPTTVELDMFSDTDVATCQQARRAMTSGVFFADGVAIYSFARRQGVQSTSSGEAEVNGATTVSLDGRLLNMACSGVASQ